MATSVVPRPAGWFPDPYGTARWRWWDGRSWTGWTEAASQVRAATPGPPVPSTAEARAELDHLAYVRRFVADAFDQQLISADAALALEAAAESRLDILSHRATSSPATPYAQPAPSLAPLAHPAPVPRPKTWWDRTREAIAADLSVHGLAYLGVLLVFAGIFGTLVWGFRSFTPQQRAWVELGVPLVLLGAGFVLNRAGAPYVAAALTLAGGLLLPLVLIASVLDGAPIPPDPETESARYATLVALPLLTAIAYALIGLKRPSSPLRFLAGPALWLAAAMAALPIAGPVLGGFAVATPHPAQMALAMAAVPLTLLLVRLPALRPLGAPTEVSAVVGTVVLVLLGALASISEDAVGWPLAATLALVAVTAELLATRADDRVVNAIQVGAVAGAVLALAPVLAAEPWGLVGLVAGVLLAEWTGSRRPEPAAALSALALGGAASLALLAPPGWYAVGAFSALTAWALLRHLQPKEWLPSPTAACIVGLAPLGALAGLAAETSLAVAAASAGVAALAVAVAVANRSPDRVWTAVAAGYAAASMAAALLAPADDGIWWRAGGLAAGAVALGVLRPLPAAARAWPAVTGVLCAGGLLIADTQSSVTTASWLAAAGCAVTVAAAALPRRGLLTHAGLAGSAVALVALVLGVDSDAMPETWIPVGALFAAVGAFTLARPTPPGPADAALPARARTWLGWAYLVVGAVVLLNGVAAIGAWWTVGALAAGAVLATTGAFLLRWPADLAASAIGAAHGLAASVAAAAILEPSSAESATTAALASGALVAAAAAAQWLLPRERLAVTGPWAVLGLCGLLITAVWAGSEPSYGVPDSVAFATAGGLALASAGLALAAIRLPGLGLWHAAALLLVAAVPYAWLGSEASAAAAAGMTLVAAAAAGLAVAFGWARSPADQWVGPVLTLALGLWCVGALLAEGDPDLWALALAIAAVLIAVAGLVGRAPLVVAAAAAPAYAAWVLIVATHLTDARAPWYSIPAGLALLGVVGAIRWHLRAQGAGDRGGEVVVLELVGMLVLVSAPVVDAADDPASAGLALALGVGLAAWGMVTKVRRRLAFGALTVLVTLVVIIAAPLVGLLRTWTGPLLWALVALAGLAALLLAAFLERGRGAVRSLFDRASRTFTDWE